jgi:tetratricopeptide (TPR) repeat protein
MSGCLYCHCNLAHPNPNTMNRYDPPYFTGFVIGCERCHGPGQLHAEKPRRSDGIDYTIVNPKHLPPLLREDVCQQCHLQGEEKVLKVGREQFDYRPGLPLHAFQAVFVKPPQLTKGQKAVTQVEQMHASRCFVGSKGALGCTSCHDPHRVPRPEAKAAYYRQRCLDCHAKQPCSVPEAVRRAESAEDSCIQCHMPRLQSNIAHTALTDHRVPRRLEADANAREEDVLSGGSFVPLQFFHADQVDVSSPEAGRDLGVAIVDLSRRVEGQTPIVPFVRRAQPLLEAGLNLWPNDPRGWDALGYCYRKQGRLAEAQKAYENSLRHAPEREHTLLELVDLSLQSRRIKEAIAYKERLIQVNPQYSIYYLKLADLLHQDGQWSRSNLACDNALRLNLVHNDARRLKIVNFLRLGQPEEAQREFEQLVRASPGERTALETWFDSQKRQR